MAQRKPHWVYIWMTDRAHCVVDFTDDLYETMYQFHYQAALDRTPRVGLVYKELFWSSRKAKARAKFLQKQSTENLKSLAAQGNAFLTDITFHAVVLKAEADALAPFGSYRGDNDEDSGGVAAKLPEGPTGPRVRAYEEPWPLSDDYVYEELRPGAYAVAGS